MQPRYEPEPPTETVHAMRGPVVLEFGANWCGYCHAAWPHIDRAMNGGERIQHVKVEDGPGRPLGRSYRVKLWPTLIFLNDGAEVARVVRPTDAASISEALAKII